MKNHFKFKDSDYEMNWIGQTGRREDFTVSIKDNMIDLKMNIIMIALLLNL